MLNNVKSLGETQFVLACSTNILENVLKQLQQVGMMTEIYSYVITSLDFQTIDVEPFQYGGTNITGIRMINPDLTEVKRISMAVQDNGDPHKLEIETALLMDAVQIFYETVYDLTVDRMMTVKAHPLNCKTADNWMYGNSIINLMKSKSTLGLTGLIKFDHEGFRRDFKIDILELYPQGLIKIGEWNSSLRQITDLQRPAAVNFQKNLGDNLFNKTFKVLISITPPYGMLKETTTQLIGNDRFEGFGIDVIKELSYILGFNYTFVLQEDGLYGNINKTSGEWNGMIREIIDGDSNLTKYKKVWSYMLHHPDLMMDDNDAAVVKVENENYAFLMESTTIEYVTERHCTLARVGGLLDDKGYGIAMRKYSPYRNDLSTAVLQLQEKGILTGLKIKWWKEKRGGGKCASKSEGSEATPLDLKNVGGVFLVLYIGTILGTLGSFAEMTKCIYRRAKRENISFKEEFLKELRFLVQFKQNVKEVNNTPLDGVSDRDLMDSTKSLNYVKMDWK